METRHERISSGARSKEQERMDVKLVMFTEKGERKDFPLLASGLQVGRHEQCALRIPLPEVSRRHAEIQIVKGSVVVKDLGSANGTFVNNKRVDELKLNAGDHLVIGPVVFTLQIDGEPKNITPVKTKRIRVLIYGTNDMTRSGGRNRGMGGNSRSREGTIRLTEIEVYGV